MTSRRGLMADEGVDVVIVGAGPSAAVAALRLVQAGLSVTCLEQGDWHDRAEYRGAEDDWELTARKQWSSDPNVRRGPADYPVDVSRSDMAVGMFNGVGGGTVLYNAVWPRLTPADFRVASVDGVADDWPLTYDDLAPFYDATDRQFGVSGLGGNPVYPPAADPPCPPLPIGAAGLRVARGHARLGWHWWPDTNAILSRPTDGRHGCVQRGTCGQGCGEGAKGSADVTHWPAVVGHGGRLVTGATVLRVVVGPGGLATGVEWADRDGRLRFQAADVVLLAANGIGTPRLLLASACNRFPDGLANSSGLVGRRLMLHPYVRATGVFDDPLDSWQGHNGSAVGCWQFYASDPSRGFVRGSKWSLHPGGTPLRIAVPGDGGGVWGAAHHDHLAERLGRTVAWIALCEDLPDPANRVELSDAVDSHGLPVPSIAYRFDDNLRAMAAWQGARAAESLAESGAWDVDVGLNPSNSHLLGTARMGADPATSVVDPWGMAHDVPNLGVVDGSVFVTAGAVNPTSTIAALALRAADHLVRTGPPRPHRPLAASSPTGVTGPRFPEPSPDAPSPDGGPPVVLSADDRSRFVAVAGALIPGRHDRPSPADLDLGRRPLDRVLASRPDLAGDLLRVLRRSDPEHDLAGMRADDPDGWAAVTVLVAAAYYAAPAVRAAVGYPGQVARPVRPLEFPEYVAEGLLDHVVSG